MSNGFYAHMRRNKGHTVEWKDSIFIDREKHWKGQKIKEAVRKCTCLKPKEDGGLKFNYEFGERPGYGSDKEALLRSSGTLCQRSFGGRLMCIGVFVYYQFVCDVMLWCSRIPR